MVWEVSVCVHLGQQFQSVASPSLLETVNKNSDSVSRNLIIQPSGVGWIMMNVTYLPVGSRNSFLKYIFSPSISDRGSDF